MRVAISRPEDWTEKRKVFEMLGMAIRPTRPRIPITMRSSMRENPDSWFSWILPHFMI
jgi:hypothetical protein